MPLPGPHGVTDVNIEKSTNITSVDMIAPREYIYALEYFLHSIQFKRKLFQKMEWNLYISWIDMIVTK